MDMGPKSFVPKQARIKDEDLYGELATSFTQGVAEKALDLAPPIAESALIHDNGCGTGVVTRTVLARHPAGKVTFKATDIGQGFIDVYTTAAKAGAWPTEVSKMPAEKLDFPDNCFDLSFSNFVLFMTADNGLPALREIHRTLKPGGTAIFTSWRYFGAMTGMKEASRATRGPNGAQIRVLPTDWESESFLIGQAVSAGFDKAKIRIETSVRSVPVGELTPFANTSWSWSGCPETGWVEEDEQKWDQAIETLLSEWKNGGGFEQLPNGEWAMKCTANIAIATK